MLIRIGWIGNECLKVMRKVVIGQILVKIPFSINDPIKTQRSKEGGCLTIAIVGIINDMILTTKSIEILVVVVVGFIVNKSSLLLLYPVQ